MDMLMNRRGIIVGSAALVDTRQPHYQKLKARVHQELLNRLNLERLTRTRREDAEPEIRGVISGIIEQMTQTTPLSLMERESPSCSMRSKGISTRRLRRSLESPRGL